MLKLTTPIPKYSYNLFSNQSKINFIQFVNTDHSLYCIVSFTLHSLFLYAFSGSKALSYKMRDSHNEVMLMKLYVEWLRVHAAYRHPCRAANGSPKQMQIWNQVIQEKVNLAAEVIREAQAVQRTKCE